MAAEQELPHVPHRTAQVSRRQWPRATTVDLRIRPRACGFPFRLLLYQDCGSHGKSKVCMIDQKMEFLILIEHRTETVVLLLPAHVRECCAPALAVVLPAMRLH